MCFDLDAARKSQAETGKPEKQNVTRTKIKIKTAARTGLPKMEVRQSDEYDAETPTPSDLPALQTLKNLVSSVCRVRQVHSAWKWITGIAVPEALKQEGVV